MAMKTLATEKQFLHNKDRYTYLVEFQRSTI